MIDYARHEKIPAGVAPEEVRHILSLSGGKDSAALAIYLRDQVPQIEYIFHDTDKELPETYDYLHRLEAILGKPVVRTTPQDSFDHWLTVYKGMLPSNHRRWCTKMLKLKPFEAYVGSGLIARTALWRRGLWRTGRRSGSDRSEWRPVASLSGGQT